MVEPRRESRISNPECKLFRCGGLAKISKLAKKRGSNIKDWKNVGGGRFCTGPKGA